MNITSDMTKTVLLGLVLAVEVVIAAMLACKKAPKAYAEMPRFEQRHMAFEHNEMRRGNMDKGNMMRERRQNKDAKRNETRPGKNMRPNRDGQREMPRENIDRER